MSVTSRTSNSKVPNTEKLFVYLQKDQWQNVSANFSGFVRKEFESSMRQLEEDEENFKNLRMMIEYAEVGRYNDAKRILDQAFKECQELDDLLRDRAMFKSKPSPRRQDGPAHAFDRRPAYTPEKRQPFTPDKRQPYTPPDKRPQYSPDKRVTPSPRNATYGKARNIYTPKKRESLPGTPKHPDSENRSLYSPGKRDMMTPLKRDGLTPNIGARQDGYSPARYHEVSMRSPMTPQKDTTQPNAYDDPHRLNYDSLRLQSPDKGKGGSPRMHTPNDREFSGKSDRSHGGGGPTGFNQHVSSQEMWGRSEQKDPTKLGYSTYKQEFPEHPVESYERQDKNRYRENFGSATENDYMQHQDGGGKPDYKDEFRETILVGNDVKIQIQSKNERLHRLQETPENDKRPSDLARKFKDIYMNEWTDAYDEIVKEFGAEKTVRHLLWIVTEAYLIAQGIADDQLRNLEHKSYSVMSGPQDEAWLIALEIGDRQLRDLEKSTYSIMSKPGMEHHQNSVHSRDLGESLPTSRNLLLKYRKQTAALSVPYVKQECRDRICRTLRESSGFPKLYLSDAARVVAYIYRCAETVWLMSVQDPPIVLEYITKETEGARFNAEHYTTYTSTGSTYKFGVWPMLRLDKRGPIIAKGIAQGAPQ